MDFVERLREQIAKPGTANRDVSNALHKEAAEEIERLRRDLKLMITASWREQLP